MPKGVYVRSEEYKKSISGEGNPFYGKKHTEESKNKIGNNRDYVRGENHPSYGKHIWKNRLHPRGMLGKKGFWLGKHRSDDTKQKLRLANLGKVHSEESRRKMSKTHIEEWRNPDFIEKWRDGMEKWWKDRENKVCLPTVPEKILNEIITNNNLPFVYTGDGTFWIDKFNPDFINEEQKLIIEVFGDYWHNRDDIRLRDKERIKKYLKYGYKLLIIWEHELVGNKYGKILLEKEIINKIEEIEVVE